MVSMLWLRLVVTGVVEVRLGVIGLYDEGDFDILVLYTRPGCCIMAMVGYRGVVWFCEVRQVGCRGVVW